MDGRIISSSPESLSGILKTIYLFLENENFTETCHTLLKESLALGVPDLRAAAARLLVLRPSTAEIVRIAHVNPNDQIQDRQVQADFPLLYPDKSCVLQGSVYTIQENHPSSRQVSVFFTDNEYCNSLTQGKFRTISSAPSLMVGRCACVQDMIQETIADRADAASEDVDLTVGDESLIDKDLASETRHIVQEILTTEINAIESTAQKSRSVSFHGSTEEPSPQAISERSSSIKKGTEQASISSLPKCSISPQGTILSKQSVERGSIRSMGSKQGSQRSVLSKKSVDLTSSKSVELSQAPLSTTDRVNGSQNELQKSSSHRTPPQASTEIVDIPMDEAQLTPEKSGLESPSKPSSSSAIAKPPSVEPSVKSSKSATESATIIARAPSQTTKSTSQAKIGYVRSVTPPGRSASASAGSPSRGTRGSSVTERTPPASLKDVAASSHVTSSTVSSQAVVSSHDVEVTSSVPVESVEVQRSSFETDHRTSTNYREMWQETQMGEQSEFFYLNYGEIKRTLRKATSEEKFKILQALRLRLTSASLETRNSIMAAYARHDVLRLQSTPEEGHTSLAEACLIANDKETPNRLQEGMARLVNAMASLTLGRAYLCQDGHFLDYVLIPLLLQTHTKVQLSETTRDHILVTMQKLSLRNKMRKIMISAGVLEFVVSFLSSNHNNLTDYCLEYTTALFMNLCLHEEARERLRHIRAAVVELLLEFLVSDHDSCLPYLNGAMFSIFMRREIREEAIRRELVENMEEKMKSQPEEVKQQMEIIHGILTSGPQETYCKDCSCGDQDEEVDHLEPELDEGEAMEEPNGETVLEQFRLPEHFEVRVGRNLDCMCRPATPLRKLTTNEPCKGRKFFVYGADEIVEDVEEEGAYSQTEPLVRQSRETQVTIPGQVRTSAAGSAVIKYDGTEKATKETQAQERQVERGDIEREAIEREAIEREAKEREAIEREAIEREAIEREVIEREAIEREAIEREAIEREAIEREAIEREEIVREAIEREEIEREEIERGEFERGEIEREEIEVKSVDYGGIQGKALSPKSHMVGKRKRCTQSPTRGRGVVKEAERNSVMFHNRHYRVFDQEPSTQKPPSFTRTVINTQERSDFRAEQARASSLGTFGYCSNYSVCYNNPPPCLPCGFCPLAPCQCPPVPQNRYACDCYSEMKSFLEDIDCQTSPCGYVNCSRNKPHLSPNVDKNHQTINPTNSRHSFRVFFQSVRPNLCEMDDCTDESRCNVECECYTLVFQSRPKVTRTP